ERRRRWREDVGRRHVRSELREERPEERRLSGADVARDADEAARLREAEPQVRERLRVLRRQEQGPWIRRQSKRRGEEAGESFGQPPLSLPACSIGETLLR